jgi:uncharacterized secreted protein with C-terminal beta-propeller domain
MRRLFVLILLLLLAANAAARSYTASDKALRPGWWYDPDRAGWAFTLSPAGDELAGTLLTFDSRGEATWYLAVGRGNGTTWTLPVTRHLWNVAANAPGATETVGSFTFTLVAEGRAHARWSIAGESGEADLELLELAPGYSAEDRSGHWFDPREPGHGYTVYSQGSWLTVVHYGYDAEGRPRWVYADNHGEPARRQMEALYFRRACASCDATVHSAGRLTMDLPFEDAGTASLSLALPAPLSGGFVRPTRAINLISDLPSGRANPESLARFKNATALADYLRAGIAQRGYGVPSCAIDFSPAPSGVAPTASATNVQEAGVDEADLVESDGEYTYAIATNSSAPRTPWMLRTHRLRTDIADLEPASDVPFPYDPAAGQPAPEGLYLVEPGAGAPRRLAAVRGSRGYYAIGFGFGGCGSTGGTTELELYGLGDRGRPALENRIVVDGALVASRRIGRTVYLVTRFVPTVPGLSYAPRDPAAVARNEQALALTPLERLVATIRVGNGTAVPLPAPETTLLPPLPPRDRVPVLVTVTAIPLDDPSAHRSITVVGDDDGVYVSTSSLYLATSRVRATFEGNAYRYPAEYFTDFHRIDLARLAYASSGTAPGTLGGNPDAKQFHMSEHAGHFRVLTEQYDGDSTLNRLFVFREDAAARRLDEIARLPNATRPAAIGKEHELLYAIRFAGDRAYAVTFLKVDPLYAIDLSDPRDPKLVGALDMPGFSAYLHPLPGGRLLGVGKDAVSSTVTGDDGTFAWYQGIKVALFDVTNAAAPRQVADRQIGLRGSSSALLYDHHAFATLESGATTRIAVPVTVHDLVPPAVPSSDPRTFYPFSWTGLALYELDGTGQLVDRGQLVATRYTDPTDYALRYGHDARPLIAGSAIYLFQGGGWYGAPWNAPHLRSPRR